MVKIRLLKAISIVGCILFILQLCEPLIIRIMVHNLAEHSVVIDNSPNGAAAIGVIGGADGPTSIFIASRSAVPRQVSLMVCLIMAIVPAIILWRGKKKN